MRPVVTGDPLDSDLTDAFFRDVPEQTYEVEHLDGQLPTYIQGTYYLIGPAKFCFRDGFHYRNWLDGDGMVCALQFSNRGAVFTSRYVRGRKFVREHGREPVYRTFGTAFSGDRLKRGIGTESPFNVSVFHYRDKLLAFGEQSLPMQLDPDSLDTLTPANTFDFDGALNDATPFSAHPKIDRRNGELLNFGVFYAHEQPLLIYYRFDAGGRLACRTRVPIDLPCSLHDFAASEHYVILYLNPYVLDTTGLTERKLAAIDSLSWHPEYGSHLLILCRETGMEFARIPIEGRYCLHTINAFESGNRLVIDLIEFERPIYDQYQELPDLFVDAPFGQPVRFQIDLATRTIIQKTTLNYRLAPDFPVIDPREESRPYDDVWMLGISATGRKGPKFFDRLVHAKWSQPDEFDIWACPRGNYLGGQPVLIVDPSGTCRGVIICHVFDASTLTSRFAFFDVHKVRAGPIAVMELREPILLGFHACFHASEPRPGAGSGS